jgi:hypothetical protein
MRRLLAAVGLTALAVGLLAPPAAAAPVAVSDPQGDGLAVADVRAFSLLQNGAWVRLQLRTQRGLDLSDAPTWTEPASVTGIRFNLDTKGDRKVDYVVRVDPRPTGGPEVTVEAIAQAPTPRGICLTTIGNPEPKVIRVRVNVECIGDPDHVRAFARYVLDQGADGTVNSRDRAPNVGYTPVLPLVE